VRDEKKPTIVDIVTYSLGEALINDKHEATATVDQMLKPYDDTCNAYFLYGFEPGKNDFLKNPDQNVYWTTSLSSNEILTGRGACEKYYKK